MAATTLMLPAILLASTLPSATTPLFSIKNWVTPVPARSEQRAFTIEGAPLAVQSGLTINVLALKRIEKEWVGRWPALQFMRDGRAYGHVRMKASVKVQTEGEQSFSAGIKLTF